MSIQNFTDYVNENPNWEKTFHVYKRDDAVYKRIKIETKDSNKNKVSYHACINVKTGEIWIDCSRRKIFIKHLSMVFWRPIDTVLRTLWHLTIVGPLANEIYKCVEGEQTLKDLGINTLRSLADIVRTPLYGIAMTVMHVAAVVLGIFSPNTLYETRAIIGDMERSYHRVDNILDAESHVPTQCFSPWRNLILDINRKIVDDKKTIKRRLKGFAESQLRFLQHNRFPCNNYGLLYPKNKPYISAVASGNHFCTL